MRTKQQRKREISKINNCWIKVNDLNEHVDQYYIDIIIIVTLTITI